MILEVDVTGYGIRFGEMAVGEADDGWQTCYHGGDIPPERVKVFEGL
jgi:hypothetical protein